MTNYFDISALLSKVILSDAEIQKLNKEFGEIGQKKAAQEAFVAYCKKWKLAPWVYSQLEKYKLLAVFDNESQVALKDFYEQVKLENENRNKEALRFLRLFKENNIDVIILKGNLFIHTVYFDAGYKRMNDFDMLIHPKDWPKVQEIYFQLCYIPLGFGWSGEKQEAAKFSHAGMSFISSNYHCITGTQWGLKSPTANYTVNIDDVWASAKEFDFYGEKVKQLLPEYNVLHLILHMGIFKCGTRDCMDIYNLYLSESAIDEDKLFEILTQSNAIEKAYFVLSLSNICANVISPAFLERIKPKRKGFITDRLDARLKSIKETGDMHNSYNDYFHHVEMCVFYFNLFPSFHKRAALYFRLLTLIFLPSNKVVRQLSDITKKDSMWSRFKARMKAPYLVLGLTAEEIGWKITFLLLLKFQIDTLLSLKNYFIKKDSYFDYLKSLGVNPEDIKNAVKKIQ